MRLLIFRAGKFLSKKSHLYPERIRGGDFLLWV